MSLPLRSEKLVRAITSCSRCADHRAARSFLDDVQAQWAAEMGADPDHRRISAPVHEQFDGQPWRQIIDMRTFVARRDDDLDPHRVWRTLTRDVPRLRAYLADVVLPAL